MTPQEAKKMLKAKLECLKNETSGINYDCNMRLCDGCSLNYEQGNMGEQKEALEMAIKALEQQRYKPIILQEHDAEPRTMRAILDTATYEIYVCKLTRQGAEILGMTIEEV